MGGSKTDVCIAMYIANVRPICPKSEQIFQLIDSYIKNEILKNLKEASFITEAEFMCTAAIKLTAFNQVDEFLAIAQNGPLRPATGPDRAGNTCA